jgi:hypothetical protein
MLALEVLLWQYAIALVIKDNGSVHHGADLEAFLLLTGGDLFLLLLWRRGLVVYKLLLIYFFLVEGFFLLETCCGFEVKLLWLFLL